MDTNLSRRICTINHNLRCHYGEINKLHAKETFNNIKINGDKGTTLSNGKLTGLGLPVNNSDAVNKEYVLNVIQGLDLKESVLVASTSNIDLQNLPDPLQIDGVQIKNGDRVLLKDQTSQSENGIYLYKNDQLIQQAKEESNIEQKNQDIIIKTSTNSKLEYAEDWADKLVSNAFVFVEHGDTNNSTGFVVVGGGTEKKAGEHDIIFTTFSENTNIKGSENITISKGEIISLNDNIELKGTIKANIVETNNIKSLTYLNIESDKASLELKSNNIKIKGNLISYSDDNIGSSNNYFNNIYVNNFNTKSIDNSNGHLIPKLDNNYDVGSSNYTFKTAYINNVIGNSESATKLETARTIGGVSFDGSANIDLSINNLLDSLVNNNSIWIGNDPTSTENSAEYNVALGKTALSNITTGDNNTAIGSNALVNNTTGNDNVAIGYNTLSNSTTANYNIAIGTDSSKNLTTGQYSISIGNNSLGYNSVSSIETIVSHQSGISRTGYSDSWQTIIPDSGYENHKIKEIDLFFKYASGPMNLKIEIYDSFTNDSVNANTRFSGLNPIATAINTSVTTQGNNSTANTFVFDSPVSKTGTLYLWLKDNQYNSYSISIIVESSSSGFNDGGAGNNYSRLNHTVRGVGTGYTTGDYNIAIGYESLNNISSGSNNIGINNLAGTTLTTGSDNICIGNNADVNAEDSSNQIIIGKDTTGHGDNIVVLGNNSCSAWHPSTNGQVNLGSSSYRFNVVYASTGTINTSDKREKKDIEATKLGLNFINDLNPVSYKWKDGRDTNKKYGLIAQEVEESLIKNGINNKKEIIKYDEESDRYGINYSELIAPLIKSVQELSEENKRLNSTVKTLKDQIAMIVDKL